MKRDKMNLYMNVYQNVFHCLWLLYHHGSLIVYSVWTW